MFELWRKRRQLGKINKLYRAEIEKARKEKRSPDEIERLINEASVDIALIEEEITILVTSRLVGRAGQLFLPVPQLDYGKETGLLRDTKWERGSETGLPYLTPKGITEVRSLIREEEEAKRKAILEWVTPLTGIIGAITGLLAVILAVILAMT